MHNMKNTIFFMDTGTTFRVQIYKDLCYTSHLNSLFHKKFIAVLKNNPTNNLMYNLDNQI